MVASTEQPLVSVIIRTQNLRPLLLREAINSVREQRFRPIEAVLVNDGGKKLEDECASTESEMQFNVVHFATSRGRSAAANAGLQAAHGEYICFLDDDDIFYPHHLQRNVAALRANPALGATYSDIYASNQEPDAASPSGFRTIDKELRYCRSFNRRFLFVDNYLPLNAVVFRKHCLDRTGYFDENLEVLEDWDFWIRVALEFDMMHVCDITGEFRIRHDGSNSTHRLQHLFPYTRRYIYRKYAERTLPLLRVPFARDSKSKSGSTQELEQEVVRLETLLSQKEEQLYSSQVRLRRYVNFPLLAWARSLRRAILGLPPPPKEWG